MSEDTPTLEEAFDQAEESQDVKAQGAETQSAEVQEETQTEDTESTLKTDKEQSEGKNTKADSKTVEAFADKGDLKGKTAEELEETYVNWQRAYTAKRQSERKEIEDLKTQLKEFQVMETPQQVNEKPIGQMSPGEYAQYVAKMARNEVTVQQDNAYIDAQQKMFLKLDPRLDENNPNYDPMMSDLVVMRLTGLREKHESQGLPVNQFDFISQAKELIDGYDSNINKIKKSYLSKQSKIARNKAENFKKDTPQTKGGATRKKSMSLDEALKANFK